jgi:hypothetical protein
LHEPDVQVVFLHPDLSRLAYLSRSDLTTSEMLQTHEVFSRTPSFTGQKKLAIFLGGRSTIFMFCLGRILLMQSKVVLVYGRMADEVYLLLGLVAIVGGYGAQLTCFWL